MPEITEAEQPKKTCISCAVKPMGWCAGCARQTVTYSENVEVFKRDDIGHYVTDCIATQHQDLIIVAESPVMPRLADINKTHSPFADDGGAIVNQAIASVRNTYPNDFGRTKVLKTYAVLCSGLDPDTETIHRCSQSLHNSLRTATASADRPPIVLAMGVGALKALRLPARSLKEVQSRVIHHNVLVHAKAEPIPCVVIPTFSLKMLVANPGFFRTFERDLLKAFELTKTSKVESASLEELTKDYLFPKTVEEVKDVCEKIINYGTAERIAAEWGISVDTETNTKFPHRPHAKIIAISFAWGAGKATAIPLWHKDTPYAPEKVIPYIQRVLASSKPKFFHNGKYDLKVFRKYNWPVVGFKWDSMLGEHGLEEDKKGQYGLKQLTRVMYPEFANYADNLQEMLTRQEGDSQLDNIRKKEKAAKPVASMQQVLIADVPAPKKKKKKGEEEGGFENIELDELLRYAAIDADMTRRITVKQSHRIIDEQKKVDVARRRHPRKSGSLSKDDFPIKSLIHQVAVPVSTVLAQMEFDGVRVDQPYLNDLYEKLGVVIDNTERELQQMAGKPIKLNHAQAVANLLFSDGFIHPETGTKKFPDGRDTIHSPITKTAHGQFQTTDKVLQVLVKRYDCPFSRKKLIYAKAYKARNTFCKNVMDLSALDGRLHTNYNIHGTGTGRLSSNDENMQNIPKKLSGYSIKKIFIPTDETMAFVNTDAKGAEIRIFTAYSKDAQLIKSINDGMDNHCFFASKIVEAVRMEQGADEVLKSMGLDDSMPLTYDDFANRDAIKQIDYKYGDMLDRFRTAVKRVVFGILYGAGAAKIADTIGISKTQAQDIINLLFKMFPSIPQYMADTKWELSAFGMVETYFGRRRRFSLNTTKGMLLGRAQRQAINFKIQSTSSDIVMERLVDMASPLERDMGGKLLITVHDSIAFELPKKYLSQLPDFIDTYLVKQVGEKHPWLPVAFKWDYEVGDSYGELQPYDVYMKKLPTTTPEERNEREEAYSDEEIKSELSSLDDH